LGLGFTVRVRVRARVGVRVDLGLRLGFAFNVEILSVLQHGVATHVSHLSRTYPDIYI
jgi:hypothetical protein